VSRLPPPRAPQREKIDIMEMFEGMEGVAALAGDNVGSCGEAALLSMAVSFKRLADAAEKIADCAAATGGLLR
jgi:hypothetical protein